jgi:hypothetical protein
MSTTRTARRLITLSASVALIATAPGLVGIASANDNPSPSSTSTATHVTLSPELVKAVQDARSTFKTTVRSALDTYRTAKDAIRTAMAADTALTSLHVAKDAAKDVLHQAREAGTDTTGLQAAYDTAKTAYEAAKAPYKALEDAPKAALKTAVDAAKVAYVDTVTKALAAAGMTVPANLLEVSGKHHGYAFGHLNMKPGNSSSGVHAWPKTPASLHMGGLSHR